MQYRQVIENKVFIPRRREARLLKSFAKLDHAAILIVYGRRRVGKTELIEQTFHNRGLLKFEGLEDQSEKEQIKHTLYQASKYFEQPYIANLNFTSWVEVLDLIADQIDQLKVTLYFEELQWLANYDSKLISAIKYVWDNKLRHNSKCRLILCGSSPSFMINHVLHSKALYNRSQYEIHLQAFSLQETKKFLPKISNHEVILALLTIGGIPEYLQYIRQAQSVFLAICDNAFVQDSFFSTEYQRIFISSLKQNAHYEKIIRFLSLRRFASRDDIAKHLGIKSGGSITNVLLDLQQCGFIEQYKPYYLKSGRGLYRYCISDDYLMFYYKFIEPVKDNIAQGQYNDNPSQAVNMQSYHIWLGYSFERLIRRNQFHIAKLLGFSGTQYKWGVFYNRETSQLSGYQIDLIFEHSKHVYTICEIKYHTDLVGPSIISEMEKKLELFANGKNHTIKKVLITSYGATKSLLDRAYFDRVITVDELFDE